MRTIISHITRLHGPSKERDVVCVYCIDSVSIHVAAVSFSYTTVVDKYIRKLHALAAHNCRRPPAVMEITLVKALRNSVNLRTFETE